MPSKNHGGSGGRNPKNAAARKGGRSKSVKSVKNNSMPDEMKKPEEKIEEVKVVEPVAAAPAEPKHAVGSTVSFHLAAGADCDAIVSKANDDGTLDLTLIVPELHLHHLPAEEQKPDAVPKREKVSEGTAVGQFSSK